MKLFAAVFCSATALAAAGTAHGQSFPSKPVRFVVPFAAGGSTDTNGRSLARALEARLGQPVTVENRGGVSGIVGMDWVNTQPADGYTLLLYAQTTAIAHHFQNRPFDVRKNITAVVGATSSPLVMVVNPKALPVRTVPELIAYVKANPGLDYTSVGLGSMGHLTLEMIASRSNLKMTHIAYKGGAQAIVDLVAGRVPLMLADVVSSAPHIRSGALHPLAIMSVQRVKALPDVPSIADQGLGAFEAEPFGGISGPPGIPAAVVERIAGAIKAAGSDAEFVNAFNASGNEFRYIDPAPFVAKIEESYAKWGRVIRESGIRVQ